MSRYAVAHLDEVDAEARATASHQPRINGRKRREPVDASKRPYGSLVQADEC